jgi:hypothetical protein
LLSTNSQTIRGDGSAHGKKRSRRDLLRGIGVAAFVFVTLLALTEIGLRIVDLPALRLDPIESRAAFDYDPELGWLPHPNSIKTQTASRTVTLRHNALGLRDIDLRPGDEPAIVFVGNSYVWGVEVEAEERFTERLRSDLPGIKIVNAGLPGYSTDQEYLLLRRLWPRLKPSVVVLIFGGGDRAGNSTNYLYGAFKPYLAQLDGRWQFAGLPAPKSPAQYFYNNWLANHLAVVRFAIVAYWSSGKRELTVPDPSEQLVVMIRDFVQSRGAKFLVGLQSHDPAMEALLDKQKIPYTRFDDAEQYPAWGRHWTPAGHRFVAERVKTLLSEQGLLAAGTSEK